MSRRGKTYMPHDSPMAPILQWYFNLKDHCLACDQFGPRYDFTDTRIEFHHFDRKTKSDTLSNLVYTQAPLALTMVEVHKCGPFCSTHHRDFHACEYSSEPERRSRLREIYNFKSPKYREAIDHFHDNALRTAPYEMRQRYEEFAANRDDMFLRAYMGRSYSPGVRL